MIVAAAAMHMTLLPIAPIILLPFAIIFFVIVFPFWGVGLGILGLLYLIMKGLNILTRGSLDGAVAGVYKAFRWVLTFGGFVRLGQDAKEQPGRR
ncbi:MAG TPA: hypothetical protein VGM82_01415 [Gemmatimonadaceae bacterium]|jgi:hypothetical protein